MYEQHRNKVSSIIKLYHNSAIEKTEKNEVFCDVFKDYISDTSLHGIKYLGPKTSTISEKMCWIIGCISSIACCCYLILNIWIKWSISPVILTFNKEPTQIWDIPFPAVTICPSDKISQLNYNYTKKLMNYAALNESEVKKFLDISLICDYEKYDTVTTSFMNYTDEGVINNIQSAISYTFVSDITWINNKKGNEVSDFFVKQITQEGVCFTFNSLSQNDIYTNQISKTMNYIDHDKENVGWTIENGYPETASFRGHPKRTSDNGFSSGLSFFLAVNTSTRDYLCGVPFSGYKILLHNPAEPARPEQEYILAGSDQEATIIIKPKMTKTEPSLVSMHSSTRKCFFSHERLLRFFKIYTLNNCKIECAANISLKSCGCVPFYMPRKKSTKICGIGKQQCISNIQSKIIKYKIGNKIPGDQSDNSEVDIYSKCNCLPSCSSLSFNAEISQSKFHILDKYRVMYKLVQKNLSDYSNIQVAQIDIFFKEDHFFALQRGELYGSADFFANIGGLLGLFMGFSVLSLLEIFYFLSIHLWCRLKQVK